ncbi:hypothetical protein JHK87_027768 [Glycine soja]|nr:hypothetical protein JHK87_027768 [Glycine soja]
MKKIRNSILLLSIFLAVSAAEPIPSAAYDRVLFPDRRCQKSVSENKTRGGSSAAAAAADLMEVSYRYPLAKTGIRSGSTRGVRLCDQSSLERTFPSRRVIESEEYRGSNKKSNESHKSTESMEEFVIPGYIRELVVYEKELCSDFFSNVTGCLEPSRERKKKNRHKNHNKDESRDLIKSITDFVIPGDVPAIDSLMVFDNNFFSDFFTNIPVF